MLSHRLKNIISADRVLAKILVGWITGDELDVRIGGQVVHHFHAGHRRIDQRWIFQIAVHKFERGPVAKPRDVFELAAAQIIHDPNVVSASDKRLGQIGAEFSPARPSLLFVSNAHNGAGLGTVSAFRDSFLGRLSPVGSSPYADGLPSSFPAYCHH